MLTHRDPYRFLTWTCNLGDIATTPFLEDKNYFSWTEREQNMIYYLCLAKLGALCIFRPDVDVSQPERVSNVNYISRRTGA